MSNKIVAAAIYQAARFPSGGDDQSVFIINSM
jgi:hypothetical protein